MKVFRFLSSLKLAVILLSVLIIAAATGTIYESQFTTKVARAYIYDAPWFNGWMVVLAINLAAAAFSRYPWKSHHTGFVITHAGIITLLMGALIGRIWGMEGTMTLFIGNPPSNKLITDQNEVRLTQGTTVTAFPVGINHPTPPATLPLGKLPNGWTVTMTDYAELLDPITNPEPSDGGTPAIQVRLWSGMGQSVKEWLWPDGPDQKSADFVMLAVEARRGVAPAQTKGAPPALKLPPGDRAVIYLAPDNSLTYYIQTKSGTSFSGALKKGIPIPTTWGDWELEIDTVLPSAFSSTIFNPVAKDDPKLTPEERANCSDGVKIQIEKGDEKHEEWLQSGWEVTYEMKDETIKAEYGSKIDQMPISLELKQFDVERNEGLDTPAGFKSTIEVSDALGNSAIGSCSMNEPMDYPEAFWRQCTGLTFKISQASWNPQNLKQSSVQILLDPGWLFKWSGSLMVCLGIFTMFYLRPPRGASHP